MRTRRPSALPARLAMMIVLGSTMLAPRALLAQDPWSTRMTTMDPLPIGACGAVLITLRDSTGRDVPRSPTGNRVTIADFDLDVASADPKAVAGHYLDQYHWYVCACQAATVGASATITATYPARMLAARARVPGVSYSVTLPITLKAKQGASEPMGCPAVSTTRVAAGTSPVNGQPLTTVPVAGAASPPPPAGGTASTPLPTGGGTGIPIGAAPPTGRTGTPTAAAPPPPGPPPRTPHVTGSPAEALVEWSEPSGSYGVALTYKVERWNQADPACCRATSPTIPLYYGLSRWLDPVQWAGTWMYRISAIYADGRVGSVDVPYVYSPPQSPTGFTAKHAGLDTVVLSWQKVQGAAYYVVLGPPGNTAFRVDSTRTMLAKVPLGAQTWQVSAVYESRTPGGPRAGSPYVSTSLTLSKRHYRIVAQSVRVNGETVDQQLSGDGKGDEIYVASLAQVLDRTSLKVTNFPIVISSVHGDMAGWPERVKAGTRSGFGGLQLGDVVSPVTANGSAGVPGAGEFVLWDGVLIDGKDDLVLHPTIWEVDEPDSWATRKTVAPCPSGVCFWGEFLTKLTLRSLAAVKAGIASPTIHVAAGEQIWTTPSGYFVHLENQALDRPIGLEIGSTAPQYVGVVGMLRDRVVVLSREKIEAALAAGTNTVDVRFWEHTALNNVAPTKAMTLGGDYVLTLRLERVP